MYPSLSNDPIYQSVIEFRFTPAIAENSDIKNQIGKAIEGDYPIQSEQKQSQIEFKVGQDAAPPKMVDLRTQLICKSNDENLFVVLANDRVSLTSSKNYQGWDNFFRLSMDIWIKAQSIINATKINRLGVRFINHIKMPKEQFDIDHYLLNGPKVPKNTPQYVPNFFHQTTLEDPDIQCMANYIQSFQPSENPIIIIDIDIFTILPLEVNEEVITKKLAEMRNYKNDIFFGSLTEKTINLLK